MADLILTVGGDTRPLEDVINRTVNQRRKIGSLDTRSFEQPLGRITGKASEFAKSLEASNARVIAFGASAGMIFSVQSAFRKLVEETVSVEKALKEINILLGLNKQSLGAFASELFEVSSSAGQAFGVAAEAAAEFSRQGLSAAETLTRTKDAMVLTRLSGLDMQASVVALTAALNSFRSEALTTTEVVDRMAAVDAAFAVSSADLAEAIRRVASSAESANVSLNETIAVVTAAQQITARGGAKIGNAFKTIFTRLQRPKTLEALQSLGVATTDAAGKALPLMEVMKNLAGTFDNLTDAQKSWISEQIGSVYQINILKATLTDLGSGLSLYDRALSTAANSAGDAKRRNEELDRTLSAGLIRTLNEASRAASSVGNIVIAPTLKAGMGVTQGLFGGVADAVEGEGDGIGSRLGSGIMAGLGGILAGPGIQGIIALGMGLVKNLVQFAGQALSDLSGANSSARDFKGIQEAISGQLSRNPELLRDILNGSVSIETAHKRILQRINKITYSLRGVM